jgi:hypothetical protein
VPQNLVVASPWLHRPSAADANACSFTVPGRRREPALPQNELLHFPVRRKWQLAHEVDVAGDREVGEPRLAPPHQLFGIDTRAGASTVLSGIRQ